MAPGGPELREPVPSPSEGEERRERGGIRAKGFGFPQRGGGRPGLEQGSEITLQIPNFSTASRRGRGARPLAPPPPQPMDPGGSLPPRSGFQSKRGQGRRVLTARGVR